jgi:hypothetical protein
MNRGNHEAYQERSHTAGREDRLILTRPRFVQGVAVAGLTTFVQGKFHQAGAETIAQSSAILYLELF